jgi:hypothetical protein
MKPKVFVGSSTEGLPIASVIQEELDFDAEITVWNQDLFPPGTTTIEALESAILKFDFAVFVMSPDDRVLSRKRRSLAPRDNVIFELGMFVGRLGRRRVFWLTPRGEGGVKVPTDLLGISVISFDVNRSDGNMRAALGSACNKLRRSFESMKAVPGGPNVAPIISGVVPTRDLKETVEKMVGQVRDTSLIHSPAIIFADLDGFSAINKWYGAKVCDRVVEAVEGLFRDSFKDQFWLRFGGINLSRA